MRDIETWEKQNMAEKVMNKYLTVRLIKDLTEIKPPVFENPIESTFIFGDTKSGKTVRAAFMLIEEAKTRFLNSTPPDYLFVKYSTITKNVQLGVQSKTTNEYEVLDKYKSVSFLIIDDFMTRRPTDFIYDMVYDLIDFRYENNLTTIITCNHSLEALVEILGDDRITSRIDRLCTRIEHKQANW